MFWITLKAAVLEIFQITIILVLHAEQILVFSRVNTLAEAAPGGEKLSSWKKTTGKQGRNKLFSPKKFPKLVAISTIFPNSLMILSHFQQLQG